MRIIGIDALKSPAGDVATFEGSTHGASVSCLLVGLGSGQGPRKHRHPYDETFILLEGEIRVIADGETHTIRGGTIAVVPAGAWHEFTVVSESPVRMLNVHPVATMTTEWAG